MDNLPKVLRSVWHFRNLPVKDLRAIVSMGHLRRFSAEEVIFHEGDECAGMHVLLRGKVHLSRLSANAQEQIISTIEPVIMFNELAVIDGGVNPYTAKTAKHCLTWNISHDAFTDLVRRYPDPEIGLGLMRVLTARTRMLIQRCEDISSMPVLARTANLLIELSANGAHVIDRSENPIRQLAAQIATVPEVISRTLSDLDAQGCIECNRQEITIIDLEALLECAGIDSPSKA